VCVCVCVCACVHRRKSHTQKLEVLSTSVDSTHPNNDGPPHRPTLPFPYPLKQSNRTPRPMTLDCGLSAKPTTHSQPHAPHRFTQQPPPLYSIQRIDITQACDPGLRLLALRGVRGAAAVARHPGTAGERKGEKKELEEGLKVDH
jgi:hypothetical protein